MDLKFDFEEESISETIFFNFAGSKENFNKGNINGLRKGLCLRN